MNYTKSFFTLVFLFSCSQVHAMDSDDTAEAAGAVHVEVEDLHPTLLRRLCAQLGSASALTYGTSGEGSRELYVGYGNGDIVEWDPDTGEHRRELKGHTQEVKTLSFRQDYELQLASGSQDRTVRLWNLNTGESAPIEGLQGNITCVGWGCEDTLGVGLHAGNGPTHDRYYGVALIYNQEGREIGRKVFDSQPNNYLCSLACRRDEPQYLAGFSFINNNSALAYDWETEEKVTTFEKAAGDGYTLNAVTYNGDHTMVAGGDDFRYKVVLWDARTGGNPTHVLEGHTDSVYTVAFNANDILASGSNDGTIRIWDPRMGTCLCTIPGEAGNTVWTVQFDPEHDETLAAGSADGNVSIWQLSPSPATKASTKR